MKRSHSKRPALAIISAAMLVAGGSMATAAEIPPSLVTPDKVETRIGSRSYPSPAAEPNADGSTTIWFGPKQPGDVKRGNWIQTMPGKGWRVILRLYSPLQPFFDKSWRPSEIERVG